jgi:endonuclease I
VHVQASVVDTSGAIASVTLQWGTTSGAYPNPIPMALESDSTYRTTSQIPAQSAGATVYHRIVAVGASATTTTPGLSYTLPGGGGAAPSVLAVGQMSDSTLLVQFSEPVEETSAETLEAYSVGALVAVAAVRDSLDPDQVLVTVRGIPAGARTLTVNGVEDLEGNAAFGATKSFTYVDVTIPPGYYASTTGLRGSALRRALHLLMRNHTVRSYAYALTAFATTDVKPNGKIWDMYSDVPGGTPPYEYAVGQTGQGGGEGFGYNREHTWPQSWFNEASPMVSDLHMLVPTDSYVNNARGNYPFGEVSTPSNYLSQNGSQVGPSATAGYSGVVFEPIEPYKGDLARAHLYVTARYLGQDSGWPGSPSTVGSQFTAWAEAQYRAWHSADPVSWKERLRNGAVYVEQNNRNPFVDHPEFVEMIYDSNSVVSAGPAPRAGGTAFRSIHPNPTATVAAIAFDLARPGRVSLRVYDVGGRLVRTLVDRADASPGLHRVEWDGRGDGGAALGAGLYFCRLEAGGATDMRRIARVR